ncbi:hypothetical protein WR25_09589 [Diploscapter pachys]|uniref:Methyltransferase FkbM domain-containing protein n=1 Tax=Diploscapter pachys TaxID=2018661 RepID=A0A2A2KXE8_9BILA|nr:hypothetical protein WR25_09589 [Diploscapter pachys]
MRAVNEEQYTKFGKYFPFAVGAGSGIRQASVLKNDNKDLMDYGKQVVVHIDFAYFLKEIIKESFIDDAWIDNEYAEYAMMHYFYRNGTLDRNNITICQFNMEIHGPQDNVNMKETFRQFLSRLLDDGRYGIFRPVKGGHYRLFFLNLENKKCLEKYVL